MKTLKYVLVMPGQTPIHWRGRLPSVAKLEREVMSYVVSTYPGYVNEHIGKALGLTIPAFAYIRRNTGVNGEVLVEWKAAMFTVLPTAADFPLVKKMEDL